MAYSKMIIISKAIKMAMAGEITPEERIVMIVQDEKGSSYRVNPATDTNLQGCLDTDGDGWADVEDWDPLDPLQWKDTDGDGYGDNYGYNLTEVFDENLNLTLILRQNGVMHSKNVLTNGQMLMEMDTEVTLLDSMQMLFPE